MDRNLFQRLTPQSNKCARNNMISRSSILYLRHAWRNTTVGEIIRFFEIMLHISMEPRKMGGYTSYFVEDPVVILGLGYCCKLCGYQAWDKEVMTLIHFKQIRSAFHPDAGENMCRDKCHQLCYFIRIFNHVVKKNFYLGPDAAFDE